MTEISDEPIVRSETPIGQSEGRDLSVQRIYVPPLDGDDDLFAEFDMQLATGIGVLLNKHYFGYTWKTFADSRQGVVGFSIPALMGQTLHMTINLKQFSDLTPDLIVNKAGELLERMNLPRHKFDMAALVYAQNNRHKFQFGKVQ